MTKKNSTSRGFKILKGKGTLAHTTSIETGARLKALKFHGGTSNNLKSCMTLGSLEASPKSLFLLATLQDANNSP